MVSGWELNLRQMPFDVTTTIMTWSVDLCDRMSRPLWFTGLVGGLTAYRRWRWRRAVQSWRAGSWSRFCESPSWSINVQICSSSISSISASLAILQWMSAMRDVEIIAHWRDDCMIARVGLRLRRWNSPQPVFSSLSQSQSVIMTHWQSFA